MTNVIMKSTLLVFLFPLIFARLDKEQKRDVKEKDKYRLHKICEVALHKQIDEEMHASLVYGIMSAHFNHNSVGRKGFTKFFKEKSDEERNQAQKLIDYLNERGGRFAGYNIKMPGKYTWESGLEALENSVNLEKHVYNKLNDLHGIADSQCKDQHLMDYLEKEFFVEQVEIIDQLQRYISVSKAMESNMGEYLFNKQLLEKT